MEVLIAIAIFTTALVSLAQLLAFATRTNSSARSSTLAVTLAQQKMEQLRALHWGFDALGLPQGDLGTNTAAFEATPGCAAATAGAGTGLSPSPPGALAASVDGYADYVDENGCGLGGGATPRQGAIYIRRWSIEPLPSDPAHTLVLQVLVTRRADRGAAADAGPVRRQPEEARLVTLKTRKMP